VERAGGPGRVVAGSERSAHGVERGIGRAELALVRDAEDVRVAWSAAVVAEHRRAQVARARAVEPVGRGSGAGRQRRVVEEKAIGAAVDEAEWLVHVPVTGRG